MNSPAHDQQAEVPGKFRKKLIEAGVLSTVQFGSRLVLRLISTVVLTRLLAPDIYGTFAIVLTYLYILDMISDLGFRSLVLTREGELDTRFLRVCWTVQILRGGVIVLCSALIAAGIAWFQSRGSFPADSGYTAAALPMTIIALGGASFLRGFASPVVFAYERDMRFKRATLAILSENVLALVVTILCAFWLRSIWALVLGFGFSAIVRVALSFWLFSGPSMRLDLHRPYLIIIWERGRWIIGHSTLTAIINTADRLLFSFVMSSATFGLYFIARQIIELAGQLLVNVHRQVALQLFKEITQTSDMAARRRKYYRYRRIFDAAAMLGAGALVVIAPLLIEIVFDDRYLGAAPFVQILALSLIFIPMAFIRDAYSAERRFRAMTFFSLIQATVLWSGLCIAIFIFQSLILAVFVTALHRIPDITVLLVKSRAEGKVSLRKEIQFMPLLLVGGGIGWLIIRVADLVLK